MQVKVSAILIVLGMVLAVGKIYADSEPGAIPLAMILAGVVWQVVARVRRRQHAAARL
jgi:hypothetical protein